MQAVCILQTGKAGIQLDYKFTDNLTLTIKPPASKPDIKLIDIVRLKLYMKDEEF